jgi:hypothetical protein
MTQLSREVIESCAVADLFANWITGRVPMEDGNEGVEAVLEKMKRITGLVSDEVLESCAKRVFDALGKGVPKEECKRIAAFTRCYSVLSFEKSGVHLSEQEVIISLQQMCPDTKKLGLSYDRAKAVYSAL